VQKWDVKNSVAGVKRKKGQTAPVGRDRTFQRDLEEAPKALKASKKRKYEIDGVQSFDDALFLLADDRRRNVKLAKENMDKAQDIYARLAVAHHVIDEVGGGLLDMSASLADSLVQSANTGELDHILRQNEDQPQEPQSHKKRKNPHEVVERRKNGGKKRKKR